METIDNINEILQLLKDKEILFTIKDKETVFFGLNKDKIVVKSTSSTYRLNEEEFIDLFKNENFYLYEAVNQEAVDHLKDEEYYSWKHK